MLTPTLEKAYLTDLGIEWRSVINKDFERARILEKREQEEWSKSELYDRPVKYIPRVKKKFSFINLVKMFLP